VPEQVGTVQEVIADSAAKLGTVRRFLEQQHLDALVIGRQDNFAWLTTGGDSSVVISSEMGAAYLVVTLHKQWLASHRMDGRRLLEEQITGQGYELETLAWDEGSPLDLVAHVTAGMRVGADFPMPGARLLGSQIVDMHYPLTDLEIDRYRWLGAECHRILGNVARRLQPGISERNVAAHILHDYAGAGMTVDVLIVGFDERISRYRHPMATDRPLQRYALLHAAARRWGLHANITRLVHFGAVPGPLRRAMECAQRVGAHVATMLAPGVRFADILAEQKKVYREAGMVDEWRLHFQGGITGYILGDAGRCLDPEARAVERQAYDYFITATGAKFEECMLLTERGLELISQGPDWPARSISTPRGTVSVADTLVL